MRNSLISIIFIIFFFACTPIVKRIYGIKKPQVENENSILRKALKFGLDTSTIFTVSGKDFLQELHGKSIPDGAIYDANGKYIEYRSTDSACNSGLFQFIPALRLNQSYNQPDSLKLRDELVKFRDLKGNEINKLDQADFYLVIYWTVWTGKLNKDHVKLWEKSAKENNYCNIKVLKVNLDIQESWSKEEKETIEKAVRKIK